MAYLKFSTHILVVALAVQQCIATTLEQVGQCKSSLYEKRLQNFDLSKFLFSAWWRINQCIYIASQFEPSVTCNKQTFTSTEDNNIFNLVSNYLLQINGKKETLTETSQVLSNSDGTFTILYTDQDGQQVKYTLYVMFSGISGGVIFYICNPDGTSTNDLRSLALPTKGIAYRAYGISEMLLTDSILGFTGKLRRLQRRC